MGVLWNGRERRLRAPWRLLLGFVLIAVVGGLFGLLLAVLVAGAGAGVLPAALSPLAGSLGWVPQSARFALAVGASGVGTVLAVWLAGRFLDRRYFVDYGFYVDTDWWTDFGFGLALGVVLVSLVFVAGVLAGWVRIEAVAPSAEFAVAVAVFLLVGVYEELLIRGYLLKNLLEGLSGALGVGPAAAVAALATSALFGLMHATNPAASLRSALIITFAGVLFATAYLLTGELGLPIGLHVTWNLSLAAYGFPVSGLRIASLVESEVVGPVRYTGGAFGPEAGLLGVGAIVVGIVAVAGYTYRQYGDFGLAPDVEVPALRR